MINSHLRNKNNTLFSRDLSVVRQDGEKGMGESENNAQKLPVELSVFKAMLDSSHEAIVLTRVNGEILYLNKSAERLFLKSLEEARTAKVQDFFPDYTLEIHDKEVLPVVLKGGQWEGEVDAIDANGRIFSVWQRIDALMNGNGNAEYLFGFMHDVSDDRKEREALMLARKEAEEASKAKSQFLANMSHEIRTPMNGIVGMAGLLQETALSVQQKHYLEIILSCSEKLLVLIKDILDISKIESGKLRMESEPFNLKSVLDDLCDVLFLRAQEKKLNFICSIEKDTPFELKGDSARLYQILLNIAGNAIKFTEKGCVTIHVAKDCTEDGKIQLSFFVKDSGIGIPKDRIKDLFNPFTQIDGSSTRKYEGTGLGLAISKKLIQLMDGKIEVESAEGHGSLFKFTILFDSPDKVKNDTQNQREWNACIYGRRILIASQDEYLLEALGTIIASWGAVCERVDTPESAIGKMLNSANAEIPFQIAIIDMTLRLEDSDELYKTVRDMPGFKKTELVLLTKPMKAEDIIRMRAEGFPYIISSPLKYSAIQNMLCNIMSCSKKSLEEPSSQNEDSESSVVPETSKLLIVEDNPLNRKAISSMLEKLKYPHDMAGDGLEAIEMMRRTKYNVILMDCQMPRLDGYQLTGRIRKFANDMQTPNDVPIIAVTAYAMPGDKEKCLQAGMNDYISKPVKIGILAKALLTWLKNSMDQEEDGDIAE